MSSSCSRPRRRSPSWPALPDRSHFISPARSPTDLSGEVADGTVLPEGFTADRIADARARTNAGREAAARTDPHYLTVFVTFYCGDVTQLPPPPPGVPLDGFAVEGPTVGDVIEPIQQLIDAGADSLIIIPFGNEAEQTRLLAKEIRPRLSPG